MHYIASDTLIILEFDKVRALLSEQCIGMPARVICDALSPGTDVEEISLALDVADDCMKLYADRLRVFDKSYEDVHPHLDKLEVDGYVLEAEHLMAISSVLRVARDALDFVTTDHHVRFPHFTSKCAALDDPGDWIAAIESIFDEEGQIRPDASPVLISLSKQVASKRKQCDQAFNKVRRKYADKGWAADTVETVRNGRRVLAIVAEHKRKLRGIIHDQSATGRTAFIEPEELIELNNDLFELEAALRAEQYRLVKDLCTTLRPDVPIMRQMQLDIAEIDVCLAKGRLALKMQGAKPQLQKAPVLNLRNAHHPLLLLKNLADKKETVPFDLALDPPNHILLLSGPNAGGKSILMKSVGLLQLMVQSGLLVPVDAQSIFGVFSKIAVELGDQQSIENDLSTYSSRLYHMRAFLSDADRDTLLLVDEFGSGTDPKLGGAIAEALLREFIKTGTSGVITTHYSELKTFAYKARGVVNGAMEFDMENMSPTYNLKIGQPGSSFAFEIAKKTGLPDRVLKYARSRAEGGVGAMEDVLVKLESQKKFLGGKLEKIDRKEKQLDKLVKNYERMHLELTAQRKKFKLEQKERDYQHLSELNKTLEKSVRKIQEEKNTEKAKEELKVIRKEKETALAEIHTLNSEISKQQSATRTEDLVEGSFVTIKNGTHTGKIESIDKNRATVVVGQLRMQVKLQDLNPANDPVIINPVQSIRSDIATRGSQFDPRLDIRGMKPAEALDILERFLDQAMVASISPVSIVHGKGTGTLRKLVQNKLKEYPIVDIKHPEDPQGGNGVTIVEM